jgi:hypothetical protein
MRRPLITWIALAGATGCAFRAGTMAGDGAAGGSGDAPIIDASPLDVFSDWWDPAWVTRMQLTITNGSPSNLPMGYQVGFPIELDGMPCAAANRDVARIVRDGVDISRVVDDVDGAAEWIWFPLKVPIASGATSTEYFLYCKNATPSLAPKDPNMVFDFFDDFSAGVNSAVWATQGTVVVTGGGIAVAGAGQASGDSGVHSIAAFGAGYAIDFIAKVASTNAPDFWAGFQNGFPDQPPWLHWYAHVSNVIAPDYWGDMTGAPWYGTNHPLDTAAHLYGVENYGTSSMYRFADATTEQHIYEVPPSPASLNVRLHNNSTANKVEYRMARVRKAANPPPTVVVGTPEQH